MNNSGVERTHDAGAVERRQPATAGLGGVRRVGTLVDTIRDYAIFSLDRNGLIDVWNAGAEQLFGWRDTEVRGQHVRLIFTPEDQARGAPEEDMARAQREGQTAEDRWHVTRGGKRFYASGVLTALFIDGIVTGYVKVARDLTERKALEEAREAVREELNDRVRDRTAELARVNALLEAEVVERRSAEREIKRLLGRVLAAHEEERRKIARDIHDELGQAMTALKLNVEGLQATFSADASVADALARTLRLAHDLDRNIDFLTSELRPAALEHLGLPTALADLASTWSDRFGIRSEFATTEEDVGLSREAERHLYRLVQEALHNVAKHSEATLVSIVLTRHDQDITLVIEDNGRGFVEANVPQRSGSGGLGLMSMRERAELAGGRLDIESRRDGGTSIFVRVPSAIEPSGPGMTGRGDAPHERPWC
jgi:PAS domain S-box-containing protein